jgi:uncharacterized membrane protein
MVLGMDTRTDVPTDTQLVIGPNASLTPAQALLFMALMSTVSLLIAGVFVYHGFWPILPFAGLELAALATALVVVLKRNRYREVLVFGHQQLSLQIGQVGKGVSQEFHLSRSQTRAWIEKGKYHNSPSILVLSEGSRRFVLASCLTDEDRARLCERIHQLLTPEWQRVWTVATPSETRFDLESI